MRLISASKKLATIIVGNAIAHIFFNMAYLTNNNNASVAQWIEYWSSKPRVGSSNLSGGSTI